MSWTDHAMFWHVYPLGFTGAPIRVADDNPQPRIRHLLEWLDYAVELGLSGLLLGPVFTSQTHGYDVVSHHEIDPRLGTQADFDELLSACAQRGLRVVLDGVFSHVGDQHPKLQQALQEGPAGPLANYFDIDWSTGQPRVFEGHGQLVRLNHADPQVREDTAAVLTHWLGRGIDGWRLDAAYSVDPEFWADVIGTARAQHPDAWFMGEVIHGDYPGFVSAAGVDTVTQYELWKAIWSSLRDGNFFELDWTLQRHNTFLENFVPHTFIGNHDVTRIASTVGSANASTALAILMTVGGIPSIYAGDEQGFTGIKEERVGGDDAVRPAFPDTPAELSDLGADLHRAHRELIGLRRRHPWLVSATTEALDVSNTAYHYRVSSRDDGEHLDVAIDLEAGTAQPRIIIRDGTGATLWAQEG